jgi:hypothetical protein
MFARIGFEHFLFFGVVRSSWLASVSVKLCSLQGKTFGFW